MTRRKESFGVVELFFAALLLAGINVGITSTMQRLKCKSMTETELFFAIPDNFIYEFKECND